MAREPGHAACARHARHACRRWRLAAGARHAQRRRKGQAGRACAFAATCSTPASSPGPPPTCFTAISSPVSLSIATNTEPKAPCPTSSPRVQLMGLRATRAAASGAGAAEAGFSGELSGPPARGSGGGRPSCVPEQRTVTQAHACLVDEGATQQSAAEFPASQPPTEPSLAPSLRPSSCPARSPTPSITMRFSPCSVASSSMRSSCSGAGALSCRNPNWSPLGPRPTSACRRSTQQAGCASDGGVGRWRGASAWRHPEAPGCARSMHTYCGGVGWLAGLSQTTKGRQPVGQATLLPAPLRQQAAATLSCRPHLPWEPGGACLEHARHVNVQHRAPRPRQSSLP